MKDKPTIAKSMLKYFLDLGFPEEAVYIVDTDAPISQEVIDLFKVDDSKDNTPKKDSPP